jgi:hypothetical protein
MIDYLKQNYWNIISVLVSGVGLFIAFWQLKKIADRTKAIDDTYRTTIKGLENRDTISNISTALQKIEIIKVKIRDGKINDLLLDLSPIAKLLVTLQESFNESYKEINLEKYKLLFIELEIKILFQQNALTKNDLKEECIALSQLELVLTEIQSKIRYNK